MKRLTILIALILIVMTACSPDSSTNNGQENGQHVTNEISGADEVKVYADKARELTAERFQARRESRKKDAS